MKERLSGSITITRVIDSSIQVMNEASILFYKIRIPVWEKAGLLKKY